MTNEDLIGCCGIYCGACPFHRSEMPDLAKKLKDALKEEKFDKIAVPFDWVGNYKEFKKWINFLARAKCEGCQAGGGNPFCSIRKCCRKKGIKSCAECEDFKTCKKLEWITERYRKWNLKNLKRMQEVGYEEWLKEMGEEVRKGFVTGIVIKGIERRKEKKKELSN